MLILIRGLQGSGKSTYARKLLVENEVDCILEIDDYWSAGQKYRYEHNKRTEAHTWLKQKICILLDKGIKVAVPEVFELVSELEEYITLATDVGLSYKVYSLHKKLTASEVNLIVGLNIHGVPVSRIQYLNETWEEYPGEILVNNEHFYSVSDS